MTPITTATVTKLERRLNRGAAHWLIETASASPVDRGTGDTDRLVGMRFGGGAASWKAGGNTTTGGLPYPGPGNLCLQQTVVNL